MARWMLICRYRLLVDASLVFVSLSYAYSSLSIESFSGSRPQPCDFHHGRDKKTSFQSLRLRFTGIPPASLVCGLQLCQRSPTTALALPPSVRNSFQKVCRKAILHSHSRMPYTDKLPSSSIVPDRPTRCADMREDFSFLDSRPYSLALSLLSPSFSLLKKQKDEQNASDM